MHPGDTQEAPRGTQETPRRHPGNNQETQETPAGTQEGTQEAPRTQPGGTQWAPRRYPGESEPENLKNYKFLQQFATNLTNGRKSRRYTQL